MDVRQPATVLPSCFVQGILLVYDVTDRGSFQSIKTWVDEIDRNADKHVNKILIGNKCDVDDSARAVSKSEGDDLARQYGMSFFETSAKKDIGVADAFQCIAKQVVDRLSKEGGPPGPRGPGGPPGGPGGRVELKNAEKKSGGCCGK